MWMEKPSMDLRVETLRNEYKVGLTMKLMKILIRNLIFNKSYP